MSCYNLNADVKRKKNAENTQPEAFHETIKECRGIDLLLLEAHKSP